MLRPRVLICLLALILALPSAAFAQGAGDDQYQDPFGDEPIAQQDGGEGGLGDEPPTDPEPDPGSGDGGSGGSTGGDGSGGTGSQGTTTTPTDANGLPYTGSDPRPLLLVGAAFLLGGIGLRLRTIDPNDF